MTKSFSPSFSHPQRGGFKMMTEGLHSTHPSLLVQIFLKLLFSLVSETEGTKGVQLPGLSNRLLKSTWRNSDQKPLITVPRWCLFPENKEGFHFLPSLQGSVVEGCTGKHSYWDRVTAKTYHAYTCCFPEINCNPYLADEESNYHIQDYPGMNAKQRI